MKRGAGRRYQAADYTNASNAPPTPEQGLDLTRGIYRGPAFPRSYRTNAASASGTDPIQMITAKNIMARPAGLEI